ncbi:type II secretion system protein GspK [Paucibacter sp. APW11]|uniref:Type II secretion system protein GspK n=1 Tax=Roseateles aquae TaxID=3077235 RepID=A0ABU3PFV9_9BURK|nr:type II secretion system protein GspK [Paucibacter sp. APW11]MDT9001250.1 type II secretion system protein GspK [Paucibacter sp. APW11]
MSRRAVQQGFVLPMTLWILAAITIAASYFALRVHQALDLARQQQLHVEALLDVSDTRAALLFRLASTPMTVRGLGVGADLLVLDNRPYRTDQGYVQLQDARGLLNLATFGDEQMDRLLGSFDIPPPRRSGLTDKLRDYIDADNLKRLNGAEEPEYRSRGLPPPRNAPLLSSEELRAILDWSDEATLWKPGRTVSDFCIIGDDSGINPNTAPAEVLMTLPGMTKELVAWVMERRKIEPVDVALLDRLAGTGLIQIPPIVVAFPGSNLRVTQQSDGLNWALRYNVRLTPRGNVSPWQISAFHRIERNLVDPRASNHSEIRPLPALPNQPASAPLRPFG